LLKREKFEVKKKEGKLLSNRCNLLSSVISNFVPERSQRMIGDLIVWMGNMRSPHPRGWHWGL